MPVTPRPAAEDQLAASIEFDETIAELVEQTASWPLERPPIRRRRVELGLPDAVQRVSLDAPISGEPDASELGHLLGARDPAVESLDDRMTLASLLPHLPEREQRILHMRFSGNMTQSQIATEIGISQMHVSRLLAQTLAWLREAMSGDIEPSWPGFVPRLRNRTRCTWTSS